MRSIEASPPHPVANSDFDPEATPPTRPFGCARFHLLIATAFFLVIAAFHLARSWQVNQSEPTDFRTYYMASADALAGRDPYAPSDQHLTYIYPPLLLWILAPLTRIDFLVAAEIWTIVNLVAWLVVVGLTLKIVHPDRSPPWELVVLPSLACYRWILQNSVRGQLNMLVLAVVLSMLLAAKKKRTWLAGGFLALGIHLKVLPALFIPYFAMKRRWSLLGAGLVSGFILLALPASTYGLDGLCSNLSFWVARLSQHGSTLAMDTESGNQSLAAMLYRYLALREGVPIEPLPPPIAAFSTSTVWVLYIGLASGICWTTLWVMRCPQDGATEWIDGALVILATHLVSKKSFDHHFVTHIFVYSGVLVALRQSDSKRSLRLFARFGLVLAVVLQNFYSPLFVGSAASSQIGCYSPSTVAILTLWLVFVAISISLKDLTLPNDGATYAH